MDTIKFGTDGWRAVLGEEFNELNVTRVTLAVIEYLKKYFPDPKVVVGYDCRMGGEQYATLARRIFDFHGIQVLYHEGPTTTPAISLATRELKCSLGIIFTASHNPPNYNGYKIKGHYGGPLLPEAIQEIEAFIPDKIFFELKEEDDLIISNAVDINQLYVDAVEQHFDLDKIRNSGIKIAYDAMYGSGQFIVRQLLPEASLFRCEWLPHFNGISPEPILKNLGPFQDFLRENPGHDFALVNDGDADRIGLMDGNGNYIDSHKVMLLLLHYLVKYKKQSGRVATGFSSTVKIQRYCQLHNLDLDIVPIGFKHVCALMLEHDLVMGGEESGGIAVSGHLPERDGIWNGLTILQFMAESGKSLADLLEEIKEEVGEFHYQRIDLKVQANLKDQIVETAKSGAYKSFGSFEVQRYENLDGHKYYFNDDEWLMIRPSGTEPVLRTYAEATTMDRVEAILQACHAEILN